MAIEISRPSDPRHDRMVAQLLTNVGATSNGEWIGVDGFYPFTVHIAGITNATVQLRVSNEPTKPADVTHGAQGGLDVTADGVVVVDYPVLWVKCRVSAWVAGTINAYLYGQQ